MIRLPRISFSVTRRSRAAPIHWELHHFGRNGFFNFGIASRTHHRWWATTLWVRWRLA